MEPIIYYLFIFNWLAAAITDRRSVMKARESRRLPRKLNKAYLEPNRNTKPPY